MASPDEAWPTLLIFSLIGLTVLLGAVYILLSSTISRIEIEGEEIRWFDWKGKVKVQARSDEIMGIEGGSLSSESTGCTILTRNGNIKVVSSVNDLGLLRLIIRNAKNGFTAWESTVRGPFPGQYIPPEREYNYRVSPYMPFGFMITGVIGFLFYKSFSLGSLDGPKVSAPLWLQGFLILFGTPGYWMLLTFWNEKIILGPDGIRWQKWSGKQLAVTLDQVIDFDYKKTRSSRSGATSEVFRIFTPKGTIAFSSAMGDFNKLKEEIEKLVASRDPSLSAVLENG